MREPWGLGQKPMATLLWSHPQGGPRSPSEPSGRSWDEGTRFHHLLLSVPNFSSPALPGVPVGLHPGCAYPPALGLARSPHSPCVRWGHPGAWLPWHAAALHGSPPRGAPTMGTAGSSGQSLHDDGQMTERTQVCSCGPSHPETPAHYLFSLPQEVSL